MRRIIEYVPVEFRVAVPLRPLSYLAAHEEKFFAGMRDHV
ncbi:hypothetical protein SDC9_171242 [bioreactor metagenome]|uniref:Uncharacterized protein n=1 Tax=bioreactor metagenome TaxID=1076179 RepID=A0A645GDK5_9ZZZZ